MHDRNPKIEKDLIDLHDSKSGICEMFCNSRFSGFLWNKLFRKELLIDSRLQTDINIYEDILFVWELFVKANKIIFSEKEKYHYIVNKNSALRGSFKESFFTSRIACNRLYERMNKTYPEKVVYVERMIVQNEICIARKLAGSGKLSKIEYKKIKQFIGKYFTKEAKKIAIKIDLNYKKSYPHIVEKCG